MPGPNKNYGQLNADAVGSETNPTTEYTGTAEQYQDVLQISSTGQKTYTISEYADGGAALQAAFDELPTRGGVVIAPQTDITLSSTLTLPTGQNSTIVFTGYGDANNSESAGSRLVSTISDSSNVIEIGTSGGASGSHTYLRDFAIEGSGSDGAGIRAWNWNLSSELRRVSVSNVGGAGIWPSSSFGLTMYDPRCYGNASHGILLDNNSNSATIHGGYMQNNDDHGILLNGGNEISLYGTVSEQSTGANFRVDADTVSFYGCYAEGAGPSGSTAHGWNLSGGFARIYGGHAGDHESTGVLADGADAIISGVWFNQASGNIDVQITGGNCVVRNNDHDTSNAEAIRLGGGSDHNIDYPTAPSVNIISVTRPRYRGIIGGGPLGGVDVGSTTGADEGDIARADGTTGDADGLYILKSNGDWQAVHDPTTTITPA